MKSHINKYTHMVVSVNGGTPIAGLFIRENPNLKWMMTRGTPISGNLHICKSSVNPLVSYCGWKKSCTTLDNWNPYGTNHLSTGSGFLPFTVYINTNHMLPYLTILLLLYIYIFNHILPYIIIVHSPHTTPIRPKRWHHWGPLALWVAAGTGRSNSGTEGKSATNDVDVYISDGHLLAINGTINGTINGLNGSLVISLVINGNYLYDPFNWLFLWDSTLHKWDYKWIFHGCKWIINPTAGWFLENTNLKWIN